MTCEEHTGRLDKEEVGAEVRLAPISCGRSKSFDRQAGGSPERQHQQQPSQAQHDAPSRGGRLLPLLPALSCPPCFTTGGAFWLQQQQTKARLQPELEASGAGARRWVDCFWRCERGPAAAAAIPTAPLVHGNEQQQREQERQDEAAEQVERPTAEIGVCSRGGWQAVLIKRADVESPADDQNLQLPQGTA